jgi:hypothetical protein
LRGTPKYRRPRRRREENDRRSALDNLFPASNGNGEIAGYAVVLQPALTRRLEFTEQLAKEWSCFI